MKLFQQFYPAHAFLTDYFAFTDYSVPTDYFRPPDPIDNALFLRILPPMKLTLLLGALALAAVVSAHADPALYQIPLKDINGKPTSLEAYKGKVLMVVNVASRCGNTPQYEALEAVYKKYQSQGLVILGFPCNDFGAQEPGSNEEIKQFCTSKYNVTFPMFDKLHVKGAERHPLYEALTGPKAPFPGDVKWNFGKFIVDRNGNIIKRVEPKTKPDSPEVIETIEKALAAK